MGDNIALMKNKTLVIGAGAGAERAECETATQTHKSSLGYRRNRARRGFQGL